MDNKFGRVFRIAGSVTDITSRIKLEKKMRYLAFYDPLSRLPNRIYAKENLPHMVKSLEKNFGAIIYIDLDNFKNVNYALGHNAGDNLVTKISSIIKKSINAQDIACHIGIDKFLILIRSVKNELELAGFVYDLTRKLRTNIIIENYNIYMTASLGVAVYPKDGKSYEELFKNADTAMNFVKNSGKSNYKFFESEMKKQVLERVGLEKELRQAVENNEFKVVYQPKVNISTGELDGAEALIRWNHPVKGLISPDKFIPLAEEIGLIGRIGEFVIRTVCEQNKQWQVSGYKPVPIAVNLSVKQLNESSLINLIKKILNDTKLYSKWLEFEITESMIIENFQRSEKVLNKIREIGMKIYLDDFGTGYSSLNYLKSLPINYIKIDKSFIDGITTDEKQRFIASVLINLAHGIGLKVVAEGVEKKEQLIILQNYGCDIVQGYIFSKPISKEQFEDMLKENIKFSI